MQPLVDVAGAVHAVTDPAGFVLNSITGLLGHLVSSARDDVVGVLDRFLFRTVDPTVGGNRALTANPNLRALNLGMAAAVDVLVAVVFVVTSVRSMLEHTLHSRYDLKVVLPRVLLAVLLAHGSLLLMQMAIDLDNALGSVALSLGSTVTADSTPWAASIAPVMLARLVGSQDIFAIVMSAVLVATLVILVLTYVIRSALLNVLVVTAPLAALLGVMPDTRMWARSWAHLFLTTVFMQAVQLVVLRVAITMEVDSGGGLVGTVYAIATLWLMLKVPGAMNTGVHLESKAHTMLHTLERTMHRQLLPPHRAAPHRRPV
ncbi:MAG: conjugal transfer protein TrbL family protein [Candidatus Dormibacteria bacterium]